MMVVVVVVVVVVVWGGGRMGGGRGWWWWSLAVGCLKLLLQLFHVAKFVINNFHS